MSDSTTIKVRVPRELKRQLEKAASDQVRTVSNLASLFLQKGVAHLSSDFPSKKGISCVRGVAHLETKSDKRKPEKGGKR